MEEGLATYVEEVARVRAGWISEEEFWGDLRRGFARGLLQPAERGLNGSNRWGPLYWGGALFWFLADVEIREQTGGKRGLEDALRGVLDAGGSIAVWWPTEKVLEAADAAAGGSVLRGLYDRFGRAYLDVDLEKLWGRLGSDRALAGITESQRGGPRVK
jgi:predicted metalloprotease with PDZ domain